MEIRTLSNGRLFSDYIKW